MSRWHPSPLVLASSNADLGKHLNCVQSCFLGELAKDDARLHFDAWVCSFVLFQPSCWRSAETNLISQNSKTDLPGFLSFHNALLHPLYTMGVFIWSCRQTERPSQDISFSHRISEDKISPSLIGGFIFPKPTYSRLCLAFLSKQAAFCLWHLACRLEFPRCPSIGGIFIPAWATELIHVRTGQVNLRASVSGHSGNTMIMLARGTYHVTNLLAIGQNGCYQVT